MGEALSLYSSGSKTLHEMLSVPEAFMLSFCSFSCAVPLLPTYQASCLGALCMPWCWREDPSYSLVRTTESDIAL